MSAEEIWSVERRAAVHAALADAARLRIVDVLRAGDAAPSELAEPLGMPSNLLAHHVKALERAGVLTRRRSEGDRRRTYLRLVPAALAAVSVRPARAARRVLFVCTANSARSQLAVALWRRASPVPAASAGTHPAERVAAGALAAARRHGLPLRAARPRPLPAVRAAGDLVVTVCDRAHEELSDAGDVHWSVPDPVPAGTAAAFDLAVAELADRVAAFAPLVEPTHSREDQAMTGGQPRTDPSHRPAATAAAGGDTPTVLFLCVHNAGRSQMALGFFRHYAGDRAVGRSGGSQPREEVNPVAVRAMLERGVDISGARPAAWTDQAVRAADVVVTMGCGDSCPVFPGKRYEDWQLADPAGRDIEAVRPIRDEIERRVLRLLAELAVPVSR